MTPPTESQTERLAGSLPDVPRWLEVRSMLFSGECEVLGLEGDAPEAGFVARELEESEDPFIYVVGQPPAEAIEEAARRTRNAGTVMAAPEDASRVSDALPGWTAARVVLHVLGEAPRLPRFAEGEVRPFRAPDLAAASDRLPEELRSFLRYVIDSEAPVAAAFAGGHAVSFCAAADRTESLWDVSIDTLEGYRRRGHAARCVSWMVAEMARRGKRPVWAAEETNPASLRLAAKLGFVPVDELVLFRLATQEGRGSPP